MLKQICIVVEVIGSLRTGKKSNLENASPARFLSPANGLARSLYARFNSSTVPAAYRT